MPYALLTATLLTLCNLACCCLYSAEPELQTPDQILQAVNKTQEAAKKAGGTSAKAAAVAAYRQLHSTEHVDAQKLAGSWAQALYQVYSSITDETRWMNHRQAAKPASAFLFENMPGPESWPHLQEAFAKAMTAEVKADEKGAAQQGGLLQRMFGGLAGERQTSTRSATHVLPLIPQVLSGDWQAIFTYAQKMKPSDNDHKMRNLKQAVIATLLRQEQDAQQMLEILDIYAASFDGNSLHHYHFIEVPDLTRVLDKEQAQRAALTLLSINADNLRLENSQHNPFAAVCLDVLRQHRDSISKPHWAIMNTIDASDVFEASDKKIGGKLENKDRFAPGSYYYRQALMYYIVALLLNDRQEEARKRIQASLQSQSDFGSGNFHTLSRELRKQGALKAAFEIISELIDSGSNDSQIWETYIEFASDLNKLDAVKQKLQSMIAANNEHTASARLYFTQTLLAEGKTEEGLRHLDELIAQHQDGALPDTLAKSLTALSYLYPEKGYLDFVLQQSDADTSYWSSKHIINAALSQQKYTAVQDFALRWLQAARSPRKPDADGIHMQQAPDQPLALLCRIYLENDMPDAALQLCQQAPWWTEAYADELVFDDNSAMRHIDWLQLITHSGERDMALRVCEYLLIQNNNNDKLYEYYLQLQPNRDQAMAFLNRLAQIDAFQERPLIWQAVILLEQKRFQEALNLCTRAVEIDPSDGEQGRGSRMRVYALIAKAHAGLGNTEKQTFFEQVVASIRMSEDADRFSRAGLHGQAIKMYRQGLNMFSDAYCIQTRLARELAELGRWEEAEKHFRRAFELMPDSFGRMESHCFGCEGAFEGKHVQDIAEKVFKARLTKVPDHPRAHYLMGYLRVEQGDYQKAADALRLAVKHDPDYINAWLKLLAIRYQAGLQQDEISKIQIQLLRLDPRGQHSNVGSIDNNLSTAWQVATQLKHVSLPARPQQVLQFEAHQSEQNNHGVIIHHSREFDASDQIPSPSQVIFSNQILKAIKTLVDD